MSLPYVIIDGYNLMHAAGLARRRYAAGDLERCRHRLLTGLRQHMSPKAQRQTTVVFDAFTSESNDNRRQQYGDLLIEFAPKGHDADGVIEQMLLTHSVPKRVLVVSSDHRLHKAASRRRAQCIDSEDFWDSLATDESTSPLPAASPSTPKADRKKTNAEVSDAELEEWMEEFSTTAPDVIAEQTDRSFSQKYLREIEEDLRRRREA